MNQSKSSRPTSGSGRSTTPAKSQGPVRTSAIKTVKQGGPATMTVEEDTRSGGHDVPASIPPKSARPAPTGGSSPSPAEAPAESTAAPRPSSGPRRVRLSVSRVDPWSVMKLGFLLSVAGGIVTVVAAAVAWQVLDSMGVFADLQSLVTDLGAVEQFGPILEYLRLNNIMSIAVVVAVVNVALITALTTLFAFLYNIVAALVGGLHMTLTDD
ncbi:DUF3566 domain-containing protein [Litorihabitans aurantiacus]|uniref:DUF3566 domain-containing protein n=1 Tax=Litorihabitans aurantiacus TaxID=1930061 RepID=A0AA37XHA4_9MICO|nr:DUF3566 domain-containing protein [Litorihabitans aurantiacus]GMA33096.1 hypothetical protein GCM10025875_30880 [Litorihabitans aurantiacus]